METEAKIPYNSISAIRNWLEHIIEAKEAIISCFPYPVAEARNRYSPPLVLNAKLSLDK